MEVLSNERWGVDESFPMVANTLEAKQGFHREAFEDICDNIFVKKWRMPFTLCYHRLHSDTVIVIGREKMNVKGKAGEINSNKF